jgi:hypothetical protein
VGLTIQEIIYYNYGMAKKQQKRGPGRPPKPAGMVRDLDLRIPVTADEKARIATAVENGEMASWARSVLLEAAEKLTRKRGG